VCGRLTTYAPAGNPTVDCLGFCRPEDEVCVRRLTPDAADRVRADTSRYYGWGYKWSIARYSWQAPGTQKIMAESARCLGVYKDSTG
jgi:hypothetical protein